LNPFFKIIGNLFFKNNPYKLKTITLEIIIGNAFILGSKGSIPGMDIVSLNDGIKKGKDAIVKEIMTANKVAINIPRPTGLIFCIEIMNFWG